MPTDLVQSFRIDAAELPDESLIFGATAAMREVQNRIERILHTDLPVLIRGESGTGKEVVAKFLHARSDRRDLPFVKVNCGALSAGALEVNFLPSPNGLESAACAVPPLTELAAGGTLFFDEIADLEWNLQTKLVSLLEDGPLARAALRQPSLRLVCASNCDLERAVERRAFRRDLFYRIDVISLNLKPLRERREDIPGLCEHFLDKLSRRFEKAAPALSPVDVQMLKQWNWPGNLRELENRIARAIVFGESHALGAGIGRPAGQIARPGAQPTGSVATRPASRTGLAKALRASRGNRRKAAEELNISYRSFLSRLREAGLAQRRRSPRENRRQVDPPGKF